MEPRGERGAQAKCPRLHADEREPLRQPAQGPGQLDRSARRARASQDRAALARRQRRTRSTCTLPGCRCRALAASTTTTSSCRREVLDERERLVLGHHLHAR